MIIFGDRQLQCPLFVVRVVELTLHIGTKEILVIFGDRQLQCLLLWFVLWNWHYIQEPKKYWLYDGKKSILALHTNDVYHKAIEHRAWSVVKVFGKLPIAVCRQSRRQVPDV